MNTMMTVSAPAQAAQPQSKAPAGKQEQNDSFAQVLEQMATAQTQAPKGGTASAKTQKTAPNDEAGRQEPAIAEADTDDVMVQAGQWQRNTGLQVDDKLSALLDELIALMQGSGPEELDEDGLQQLYGLVERMLKRLQQLNTENGQQAAAEQMMWLVPLVQHFVGQPTQMAEAPVQNNELYDRLVSMEPKAFAELLEMEPAQLLEVLAGKESAPSDFARLLQAPVSRLEYRKTEPMPQVAMPQKVQAVKTEEPEMPQERPVETKTAEAAKEPLDVDRLQKQVDAGVHFQNTAFAPATTAAKEPAAEEMLPLANQLEEGIANGIRNGKEEFTIQLRPEGLGELTVKLTRVGEAMTLNIVAKSTETHKLLADEMQALREVLRPLKVEVESVLTESQSQLLSQQQQFEQQRQQSWQQMQGAAYYGDEPLGGTTEEQPATAAIPPPAAYTSSALDTYI